VGDRARRSGDSGCARDRAGRRGPRRCRIVLFVVGGLVGPGYWLYGSVWGGRLFGRSPADTRFTEFVLAMIVVVVASWGLLLILGEALLFALAVVRADDRERYDIYRNLMILWGYVLTLGIPRHFRKLPAQFGALPDDARARARGRAPERGGEGARRDGARRHGAQHDGSHRDGADRERAHRDGAHRDGGHRDGGHRDGGGPCRDADVRDDRTERGGGRRETAPRQRVPGGTASPRTRAGGGADDDRAREGARRRPVPPEAAPRERAASLGAAARERSEPLGPIFPPRPAAEAETTPGLVAGAPVPVAAGPAAEVRPETELRDALDLIRRYAERFGTGDAAASLAAPPDTGPPPGFVAEAGGDA
jgi:hypothetical protein